MMKALIVVLALVLPSLLGYALATPSIAMSPVAFVADGVDGFEELGGPKGITTVTIGSSTYALVAAYDDDGVQIVDITDPFNPSPVAAVTDGVDGFEELRGARGITTATVGSSTYALVTAAAGVQIIDITTPSSPAPTAHISAASAVALRGSYGIATFTVGSSAYAIVASSSGGIQIIDITDPSSPAPVASILGGSELGGLGGARGITTTTIGSSTYALVAVSSEDAVQIIDITDPFNPSPIAAVRSSQDNRLDGATGITTATIGSSTYALVTAQYDNAVQIINITDPSSPDSVAFAQDGSGGFDKLEYPESIAVVTFDSSTYAIVAAFLDGIQIINITDPSNPSPAASVDSNDARFGGFPLPEDIAVVTIDSRTYALAASYFGNGVQIIDVALTSGPLLTSAVLDEGTGILEIEFASAVDVTPAGMADLSGLTIRGSGQSVSLAGATLGTEADSTVISIELTEGQGRSVAAMASPRLDVADSAVTGTDGNPIEQSLGNTVTVNDDAAPGVVSAAFDGEGSILTITFSDRIDVTPARMVYLGGMTVSGSGQSVSLAGATLGTEADSAVISIVLTESQGSSVVAMVSPLLAIGHYDVVDTDGNPIASSSGNAISINSVNEIPTVTSIERSDPTTETASAQTLVFAVTFSENVAGVDQADFALSPGSTGAGSIANLTGSGSRYLVTVSVTRDGTYNLDIAQNNNITDATGNPLAGDDPLPDQSFTVVTVNTAREVGGITLTSTQPGTIQITWEAPSEAPKDYRVVWAKAGENFLPRSDLAGNAFPTSPNHTITDLEEGEEYKVKVRARYYSGGPGDWSGVVTPMLAVIPDQTVDAGPDQTVMEGQTVALNGTAADINGDPLTYSWIHDSALAIQFANATSPSTTFTAPAVYADTAVTFTLTVNDGNSTASDQMTVTIAHNDPPTFVTSEFDTDAGVLTITFSETIDVANVVPAKMHVRESGNYTHGTTLTAGELVTVADGATISFTLTEPHRTAVARLAAPELTIEPGAVRDASGNLIVGTFDASTRTFVDATSIRPQENAPTDIAFSNDGTKMFVMGTVGDDVNEYTLSTPFDASTRTFVDATPISSEETLPTDMVFSNDGTKMFVIGTDGADVNEYTLSTPFDASTLTFVDATSISSQDGQPRGMAFSNDGTKMFVLGNAGDDVNEYTLSTPFDASTLTFVDATSISSQVVRPQGIAFSNDGTKMFVLGNAGDDVNEYALSTPFDASTLTFVDATSISSEETFPTGMVFLNDGTKMFIIGIIGDDVNEYDLSSVYPITVTRTPPIFVASELDIDAGVLTITFSETIDAASIVPAKIHVRESGNYTHGTTLTAGELVTVADGATISFTLAEPHRAAVARLATPELTIEPGAVRDASGNLIVGTFDVSTQTFVDATDISSQETQPRDIAFSNDGTKMFIVGDVRDNVNEYTLSTPFDASTRTFVDATSIRAQDGDPRGMAFSNDGTKMFVIGYNGDNVNEYALSAPFDASTLTFVDATSIRAQEDDARSVAFSNDGTKMFVMGVVGDDVNEYTLSTPFDASTRTFVDATSISSEETFPTGMVFSNDGTKMFVIGWEEYVNEYALSTPFDASTRTYVDDTSISSEEVDSQGIAFSNDGAKMFIIGIIGDDVNEYDLSSVYPVTVTRAPPMTAGALVTLWNVAASPHTISMPLNVHSGGTLSIDWGDNSTDTVAANGTQSHTYAVPGEYRVSMTGDLARINLAATGSTASKLASIDQWGDIEWSSMKGAFWGASGMEYKAADAPDLSRVASMQNMFRAAASFDGGLSSWNVSAVANMDGAFRGASAFKGDISTWDMSGVTDMRTMFQDTAAFNGDISGWNVSSVTNMNSMFSGASSFDQPLDSWNVSSVTNMNSMFSGASSFNQPLDSWNVSSVEDTSYMFSGATAFNQPLDFWDVSSVTDMNSMFGLATSFDGDISDWVVSSVTDMNSMFSGADSFDQNLGKWYIVLNDMTIDYNDAPGIVGSISAQNSFLDGQNPVYGIGSGDDSHSFELNGSSLVLKAVPAKRTYTVNVTSVGDFGTGNSKMIEITVSGFNTSPTVNAGEDQAVQDGTTVTLSGTAADNDGDQLTYAWSHDSTLPIVFANDASLSTTFTAPAVDADTEITFTLTADDGTVTASDSLAVTVTDVPTVNSDPVVDAGPDQTVDEGYLVTLNATVTDADGDNMTYSWTHDSPLAIQLVNSTFLSTTFTAPAVDADTEITFTLTADDGTVTASDSLAVTVTDVPTVNSPPVANAGPDQDVAEGSTVNLDSTASDSDAEDTLTYSWSHNSTLPITLDDGAALDASFTAPNVDSETVIEFTLEVNDGTVTVLDTMLVTIQDSANSPPSVNAGPDKTVQEGQAVTLNGTATDTDGDGLTYAWSYDSSTEITFNASSPVATFAAPPVDADTTVTFTLAVSDGSANSTDAVLVTVIDVPDDSDFVTTWETAAPGESITIPARGTYTISWGDGTVDAGVTGDQTHAYDVPGNHTIRISKGITGINLGNHADAPKLRSIDQWGDAKWSTMYSAFRDASNMTLRAADAPDLSRVKYTQYMFLNASSFDGDLSAWDVSHVTNMVGMFWEASSFDGDLSAWDVSSVTDMFTMFYNARSFDGDLSAWDVSSVTGMASMFHGASSFDGDLSAWDVSSVTDTYAMFLAASSFDGDLSGWDVSRVTDMADMFRSASSFDGDVSGWDVSRATRMSTMFYLADSFDQNLGEWYIVLDDAAIDHSSVPGEVGRIAAQNRFLDGHNPAYGIGSGGDSAHFEIDGDTLRMKSVPDGHAGPYSVTVTSTGDFGTGNSRTFEISVTEGDANTPPVAPSDPREVGGITVSSTQPGTIQIDWDAPSEQPREYRVTWAKSGEDFPDWRDLVGNAFPTSTSQTITGLEEGEEYQVKVRARYDSGGPGGWSDTVTITVARTE